MKKNQFLLLLGAVLGSFAPLYAAEDIVFEGFDSGDFGAWTVTGTAFGSRPVIASDFPVR